MKRFALLALAAVLGIALSTSTAAAAGVDYPDADWSQASITEPDGTVLHADVLRPKAKYLPAGGKTPVIVSIGPYFGHSGQTGPAGPAENAAYDPVGPSAGPSERFQDFIEGSGLLKKGYTFVMVDLRGFGGSTGCLDWGGPGEQADVYEAVKWAATQPWSTGKVGMYGKSYDGVTGLIGAIKQPPGLAAVVSQEPVYDMYRYLYGDGIRRNNAQATPALYDVIEVSPGPVADDPMYTVNGANSSARPGCHAANWADQALNDDHYSPYWRARNLIPQIKGSQVPIFLTQGLTENNTVADGTAQFLENHPGPERGWLGPWEHVRGNEKCGDGDGGVLPESQCNAGNKGKYKMGRASWFAETMDFYDHYLKGAKANPKFAPWAVQTNDGVWRPEEQWPPKDVKTFTTDLKTGTYSDNASMQSVYAGEILSPDETSGVWTVSQPFTNSQQLIGSPTVKVDVSVARPNANLNVALYDLDASGKGPLISRQGYLIRHSGEIKLDLWSVDWKIAKGHRLAVRVYDVHTPYYIGAVPSQQDVTVHGGSITLPFATYSRPAAQRIEGAPGVQLANYLGDTTTPPAAATAASAAKPFAIPGPQLPQPDDVKARLDAFE